MQYLFGCSTAATSDTLPIHYVGLLRKRVALYLQPWYRPKTEGWKRSNDETNLPGEEMSIDAVKTHEKLSDERVLHLTTPPSSIRWCYGSISAPNETTGKRRFWSILLSLALSDAGRSFVFELIHRSLSP